MKLKECRERKGQTVAEACAEVGVGKVCWGYWERDEKKPSERNYPRILKWSGGRVTPNDFYDLPYHLYKRHKRR